MKIQKLILFSLNAACMVFPANASLADDRLIIENIQDGSSVVLSNQQIIRLAGIDTPDEIKVKEFLMQFVGQPVALNPYPMTHDRHGNIIAELILPNNKTAQEEMLRTGVARVYPFSGDDIAVQSLLLREKEARGAKRGIWQSNDYKIMDAARTDQIQPEGSFQIVKGTVKNVEKRKGATYINFGDDYRTDFTLFAVPKDLARFRKAGKDLLTLPGKTVQVRGWLYNRHGPAMDLTEIEQLEIE